MRRKDKDSVYFVLSTCGIGGICGDDEALLSFIVSIHMMINSRACHRPLGRGVASIQ